MLEFYQYITSSFGVFFGATAFTVAAITSIGWALNAVLIGIRGVRCSTPDL